MLDAAFFRIVGPKVRERYRNHIFDDAKDVKGRKFKGYSTHGSKWVTMNVKKSFKQSAPKEGYSYSKAKKGKMFPRQSDKYANKTSPVLSGDLYRDFTVVRTSPNGFILGWQQHGAKIEWLKSMGRVLTTKQQPLPEGVLKYLNIEAHKEIKKQTKKKIPNKTVKHKIGK